MKLSHRFSFVNKYGLLCGVREKPGRWEVRKLRRGETAVALFRHRTGRRAQRAGRKRRKAKNMALCISGAAGPRGSSQIEKETLNKRMSNIE